MTITYIRIPVELLSLKPTLERTQLMILALALAFGEKGLKLSNNELSRILKVKRRNIIKAINGLRDDGHLNGESASNRDRRLVVSGEIARLVVSSATPFEDEGSDDNDTINSDDSDTTGSDENDTKIVSPASPITKEQKIKQKNKRKDARSRSFLKPSVEEVSSYAKRIGYDSLNSQSFIDYYESNGWRVGRNAMKDWCAAVRTWQARDKKELKMGAQHERTKARIRDFEQQKSTIGTVVSV